MHGITLTQKPADWEIIQQTEGSAPILLSGTYQVHPAAIDAGVESVCPMVRIMSEEDNSCILPWQEMEHETSPCYAGTFTHTIRVPAGGLYRIETCLETKSTVPDLTWLFRGDCALHIGIGNLFLIAGQSNAAGYSRDYAFDPPDMKVHLYRNRSRWDLASHPMNESTDAGSLANEEMGIPGVSPYLSFAKNYLKLTGLPVGLIQTSLGGSPMKRWNPADGDLYRNLTEKIAQTHGRYSGILWYQGCADSTLENAAHYAVRFREMVTALRNHLGYEIPFFTLQLNRELNDPHNDCWGMVRDAQRKAAHEINSVYILPTINSGLSDSVHNNAHSNVMLGEKLAKLCYHVLDNGPAFAAPELSCIRLTKETELELTFSNMALGFILPSGKTELCGFTISDGLGSIPITALRSNRQDKNHIYLTLERHPESDSVLSFAWEANPTAFPPVDEVTFLPPLSFYRVPVFS